MKYWKHGNDLYTADTQPIEDAIEITAEEYAVIYNTRQIKHLPELEEIKVDDNIAMTEEGVC